MEKLEGNRRDISKISSNPHVQKKCIVYTTYIMQETALSDNVFLT